MMKKHFHLRGAICCCLFAFTTTLSSFAQSGSLDPQFGPDGSGRRFIVDFNLFYVANKTLEMPDGKILISGVGATDNGNKYTPFVARLLPNGNTDVDFAESGFIRNEAPLTFEINCWSLIRQPDGKILQSGRYYNVQTGRYDLYIMRYLENGLPDETFGNNQNGIVIETIPGYSIRYTVDLLLQPDGKIVAPGCKISATNNTGTLIYFRYLPDGTPDPEFGVNGVAEIDLGFFNQNTAYLQLLPDGKILGAGTIISSQDEYLNLIVRLNPDGTLDNTFGDEGFKIFSYGSDYQAIRDLKTTADGRILVAGYVNDDIGNTGLNFAIARFNSDGSLDETFGDDGYRFLDAGTNSDIGTSIDLQPDGKILFAGNNEGDSYANLLVFRLNEDGTTDQSFGVNGSIALDDRANSPSITVQSNGTALIGGQGETSTSFTDKPAFYIARMLLDLNVGTFESGISDTELMFYPNPIHDHALLGYELLKDQDVEASIYKIDGTLVGTCMPKSRQTTGKHQEQLQIAPNLPAGHYLLKVTAEDVVKTVRFIKN